MEKNGSGAPGTARQDWAIRLAVAVFASVIVAILGPFGTYDLFSFPERLLYWGGLIMGLVLPAFFVRTGVYRFLSGSPLYLDIISAVILSLLIGPVVWVFNHRVMEFDVASTLILAEHIGIVALICLVPVSIRAYLRLSIEDHHAEGAANAPQSAPMTEAQAAFLRRLEPEVRGYVLRVSADNHQVEVWTDRGSSKLRLRFSDALEELMDFDGTRIHRSHWIAFSEISAVVPAGRRHLVHLNCGAQLPVSQNGLQALQAAGVAIQDKAIRQVRSA